MCVHVCEAGENPLSKARRARADFAKSRLNWRRVVLLGDGSNGQYEKVSRRALSFPKNDQRRRRRRAMIL